MGALRQRSADAVFTMRSKAEWTQRATEARARAQELGPRVRDLEAKLNEVAFEGRRTPEYQAADAQYKYAQAQCAKALEDWERAGGGRRGEGLRMPAADDEQAMSELNPRQQEIAQAYHEAQQATEVANQQKWDAERNYRARPENSARREEASVELSRAKGELRDAQRDAEIAERAVKNYDRDQERMAQRAAGGEAKEPTQTPATQYSGMSPASLAVINANSEAGMTSRGSYVRTHASPDDPEMLAVAKRLGVSPDAVPYADRPVVYKDRKGNRVEIEPGFEATIRDNKDFKTKMGKMFPGADIKGLPRNADKHVLTMVHDEFKTLRDEYPEVAVREIKMNASGMGATAYSHGDRITFGKDGITSFTAAHLGFGAGKLRETSDAEPDFHDGSRSYASVVRHEFAHQLDFQHPEIKQAFMKEVAAIESRRRTKVTEYARKNDLELFAETFSMLKYGDKGTKAHPTVKAMDRVVKAYFARIRSKS
jgi:hypothetical protein